MRLTVVLLTILTIAACGGGGSQQPEGISSPARAPGAQAFDWTTLTLPVPRTFDLAHVDPAHVAAALGKDPIRLFEFVRDHVAFESYAGSLRGPRGTLLAMAGNAVDRSLLLASLLEHAGKKVRFARGTLGEKEARDLVAAMAAPRPKLGRRSGPDVPPELNAAATLFTEAVKRDYSSIKEVLQRAGGTTRPVNVPAIDTLVQEAREHYWVQWDNDGRWTDLDPIFADAVPGRAYVGNAQTLDVLPESLAHRVTVVIRLEEDRGGAVATREILRHTFKAAALSGVDVLLTHQPEKWNGPAASLGDALSAAIEDTGSIKPVLTIREENVMGDPFRARLPAGIGSIPDLLRGQGTQEAPTLATAEWMYVEFSGPNGQTGTAVREIFDRVGPARRARGIGLTADELQQRVSDPAAPDPAETFYSLFFTTGRLEAAHLVGAGSEVGPLPADVIDVAAVLRRVSVVFTTVSDQILTRLGRPGRTVIRLYPDSPRLIIAEASIGRRERIAIDLRHVPARAVAFGPQPEDAFSARILKGVIEGNLERSVLEYGLGVGSKEAADFLISAGRVFEEARRANVSLLLLPREAGSLAAPGLEDASSRLADDTGKGFLAIVPGAPVPVAGRPRLAWWRIDPRSGETTAVTDEGLHATVTEYKIVEDKQSHRSTVVVRQYYVRGMQRTFLGQSERNFANPGRALGYIDELLENGATLVEGAFWP